MARKQVQMDPAVLAALSGKKKRQRKGSNGQTGEIRKRMTLELDHRVRDAIKKIAEAEGVSPAGVVNLFVAECVPRYKSGELEFAEYVRPADRAGRYEWVVEPPIED